jgi:CRP-like cAMP-binding protein
MAAESDAFLPLFRPARGGPDLRELRTAADVRLRAGQPYPMSPDRLGIVTRGALLATSRATSDETAYVDILGPGDAFGDDALLDTPRWADVEHRALVAVQAISVDAHEIWMAAGDRPDVARFLSLALARSGARLRRRLAVLRSLPVTDRLAVILRDLARTHGLERGGEVRIALPLTQDLLATLIGCTRESVNRASRQLSASGVVRRSGGTYLFAVDPSGPAESSKHTASPPPSIVLTLPSRSNFTR